MRSRSLRPERGLWRDVQGKNRVKLGRRRHFTAVRERHPIAAKSSAEVEPEGFFALVIMVCLGAAIFGLRLDATWGSHEHRFSDRNTLLGCQGLP